MSDNKEHSLMTAIAQIYAAGGRLEDLAVQSEVYDLMAMAIEAREPRETRYGPGRAISITGWWGHTRLHRIPNTCLECGQEKKKP